MKSIFITIVIVAVLVLLSVWLNADTVTVTVQWDYYPEYGSPDAAYLVILYDKFNADSLFIESGSVSRIAVTDTVRELELTKGFLYEIWMVAVDSTDLVSSPSDSVMFELLPPIRPKNVRITQ